ncbi:hypothetical protein [Laspinema olomoucense]|uniref:Lipoprotein n=1 Tax=Laspinema olomoucense D3b TaxID=2953688 RepID=A0ABT2NC05_9CYAN|nr:MULTISPECIES: hypothetical protein [unclassified Laspinema]MCT7980227.1 hypothetical protein [Laspinema sp. D3b]MCT7991429.1 hypothetical protein [Laspinema sp. D3a]
MNHSSPHRFHLPLSALLVLLLASCTPIKTRECRRLIQALDQGTTTLNRLELTPLTGSQAADAVELSVKAIKTISLTDETIISFQTRAVALYEQIGTTLRETSGIATMVSNLQPTPKGLQTRNTAQTQVAKAIASIKQSTEDATVLLAEIEEYCLRQPEP